MRIILLGCAGGLALLLATHLREASVSAQAPSLEARVEALEDTLEALALHVDRLEKRTYGDAVRKDLDRLRDLIGLLTSGTSVPMRDGAVDPFALRDEAGSAPLDTHFFHSARLGSGPSRDEIAAGDYTNFPYERYRGPQRPLQDLDHPLPLLWDREPHSDGGRLVGLSNGSVQYWPVEQFEAGMEAAGQRR